VSWDDFANLVTLVVTGVSAFVALAAGVSALYIYYVYHQRHEDALFLTRLVHRDLRVSLASAVILIYIVLALSGFSLGKPWGALIIGGAITIMMIGPISDALLWKKERSKK
jgi:hypothetical protein